jgi:hypothetical protein
MFFLIQSNISVDPDYPRLFKALEELQLPYEAVHISKETEILEPKTERTDVFVIGSVKMARLAKQHPNWSPGSFYGESHSFEAYAAHYRGNLLNEVAEVFQIGEPLIWKEGERKFIKPYKDAKLFTGKLFTKTDWEDFVYYMLHDPNRPRFTADKLMQASKPQHILKEARLWIVGGQIVGSSYYKFHGDLQFEKDLPAEALSFAEQMIDAYQPAEAFVLDICLTYEGWKVVEVNCINSAGFYPNLNIKALLKALDLYFS